MSENGIIEIDVGLQARTKAEIDEYLEKVNEMKAGLEEVRPILEQIEGEGVEGATAKKTKTTKKTEEKTEFTEALEGLDKSEIQKIRGILRNPEGFMSGGIEKLLSRLGPNARVILGIVGAVIASPILFIEIMKQLSVKGGPFNRDFRRFIAEEVDVGLSRELVKMRELGDPNAQVIISQGRGWTPNNETWVYNSYYEVNQSRIARIGLDDKSAGVTVE